MCTAAADLRCPIRALPIVRLSASCRRSGAPSELAVPVRPTQNAAKADVANWTSGTATGPPARRVMSRSGLAAPRAGPERRFRADRLLGPSLTFARADAPVLDVRGDGTERQGLVVSALPGHRRVDETPRGPQLIARSAAYTSSEGSASDLLPSRDRLLISAPSTYTTVGWSEAESRPIR